MVPIKITLVSNNGTRSNSTVPEPAGESQPAPEAEPVPTPAKQQAELLTTVKWFGWDIPTLNWVYFSELFNSFFGKSFRTRSGEFTCDESDDESPVLRTELEVDYLCGEGQDYARTDVGSQIDSTICSMFCTSNGFHDGVCMPLKSCLCYLSEVKNFAIKLDRLQDYNNTSSIVEKMPSNSVDDFSESESTCQNCRCLKSCQNRGKYIGYCSKSCHCGVPWYNENPGGNVQPT